MVGAGLRSPRCRFPRRRTVVEPGGVAASRYSTRSLSGRGGLEPPISTASSASAGRPARDDVCRGALPITPPTHKRPRTESNCPGSDASGSEPLCVAQAVVRLPFLCGARLGNAADAVAARTYARPARKPLQDCRMRARGLSDQWRVAEAVPLPLGLIRARCVPLTFGCSTALRLGVRRDLPGRFHDGDDLTRQSGFTSRRRLLPSWCPRTVTRLRG